MFSTIHKVRVLAITLFILAMAGVVFSQEHPKAVPVPQAHHAAPRASRRAEVGGRRVPAHHVGAGDEPRRIPLLGMVRAE